MSKNEQFSNESFQKDPTFGKQAFAPAGRTSQITESYGLIYGDIRLSKKDQEQPRNGKKSSILQSHQEEIYSRPFVTTGERTNKTPSIKQQNLYRTTKSELKESPPPKNFTSSKMREVDKSPINQTLLKQSKMKAESELQRIRKLMNKQPNIEEQPIKLYGASEIFKIL